MKSKTNRQKTKLIDTENKLVVGEWGEWWGMGERGQKVQISSYKINKSWACNLQNGNYGK